MADTIAASPPQDAAAAATPSYVDSPTRRARAANGVEYAYRETGVGPEVLVLLQHCRGNLDHWDPALIDALAGSRRVVTFDNTGVGGSSGTTPSSVTQMARDALGFLEVLGPDRVDVLGFSLGSFVAQEMSLIRPDAVRRLVLAASAPRGAPGMHGWAAEVIDAVGAPETRPDGYLDVFSAASPESRSAGQQSLRRMSARTVDRDEATSWPTRLAQYDAVCDWGIPDHAALQRVTGIDCPVLVANGDSDPMILPRYSYLLAGLITGAEVTIYPDAAHGFLFQHHERFARDVLAFLTRPGSGGG